MKPDLLLLHGALSDEHQFNGLVPLLSDSFNIHSFSFNGHGNRLLNKPFIVSTFMDDIEEYIQNAGMESINLFGYSMGGYISLLFAASFPGKVNKVFTLATKIEWDSAIAERESALLNPAKILEKIPVFAARLAEKHTGIGWQKLVMQTAAFLQQLGVNNYLDETTLSTIACPVFITLGEMDKTVSLEECKKAANLMPGAKMAILPGTPHPFEKVDLNVLAGIMKEFYL